jgi:hypothetical protein
MARAAAIRAANIIDALASHACSPQRRSILEMRLLRPGHMRVQGCQLSNIEVLLSIFEVPMADAQTH